MSDNTITCGYCRAQIQPRDPFHVHGHNECLCGETPRHNAYLHDEASLRVERSQRSEEEKDHGAGLLPADALASPTTTEPLPNWQVIIVWAAPGEPVPARSAWLYEKSCGVRLGSFGRFADGVAFASVPGMNGCFVRDWGATHFTWATIPLPPGVQ